jgi:hypothetical protein
LTRAGPAALLGALLFLGACRTIELPPTPIRITGEEERIAGWLERARSAGSARHALRAFGTLKLESASGSGSVKQVLMAERPMRLRLESLNFLGQTQSLLVTDGSSFWFFDGHALDRGPLSDELLRRHLGVDLGPDEAVAVLLAAPRLEEGAPLEILALGEERIARFAGQRVRFSPEGDLRSVEVLDPAGGLRWAARYERWRPVGEDRYPFEMVLRFPRTALRAELRVDEVELNPALDSELFVLPSGGSD